MIWLKLRILAGQTELLMIHFNEDIRKSGKQCLASHGLKGRGGWAALGLWLGVVMAEDSPGLFRKSAARYQSAWKGGGRSSEFWHPLPVPVSLLTDAHQETKGKAVQCRWRRRHHHSPRGVRKMQPYRVGSEGIRGAEDSWYIKERELREEREHS